MSPMTSLMPHCPSCGWRTPGGAAGCATCLEWVRRDLSKAFCEWVGAHDLRGPSCDVAELVLDGAPTVPWRVYDHAMSVSRCHDCGQPPSAGPDDCLRCTLLHGNRFAARESDRPDVPAGNEHAIRVATAVVTSPHRFPEHMVPRYSALLPITHSGQMPSGGLARYLDRWLDRGGDLQLLRRLDTVAELEAFLRKA